MCERRALQYWQCQAMSQATPAGSTMDGRPGMKRFHDGIGQICCQRCGTSGGMDDKHVWNSAMRNKFKYFGYDPVRFMDKIIKCLQCCANTAEKNREFQQAERPSQYQSMDRPEAVSPSRCKNCDCELRRGYNISKSQWLKTAIDRRCESCALEHSKNNPHVAVTNSRRKVSP